MTISTTREQRRQLERENARRPLVLEPIPRSEWPLNLPPGLSKVWRSRDFLVQEYEPERTGLPRRLSICRTQVDVSLGRWHDGITWDDIQRLKREVGYGALDAVEVFPNDRDVVNVANMRHIFLMDEPLAFAWRKEKVA